MLKFCLLAAALMAVMPPLFARETVMPAFDREQPPGNLYDVGGYRLHIHCRGSGSPAVIFDAGLGGFSMDWLFVQQQLPNDIRSCSYDRAGYGWSESGTAPRATDHITEELEILLAAAQVEPPYVLVGHSFGAFNMEYFAVTNADDVAALLLVEGSHPDQSERLPDLPARAQRLSRGTLVTQFDPSVLYRHFPESMWYVMAGLMTAGKAIAAQQWELVNFNVSAAQVKAAGRLPPVPLVVISRGRRVWPQTPLGDALEKTWSELQAELVASIPGGRQVFARNSGHLVHLDEPALVAEEIRRLVDTARRRPAATSP